MRTQSVLSGIYNFKKNNRLTFTKTTFVERENSRARLGEVKKNLISFECRHILMDHKDGGKILKRKAMTRKEAEERNAILEGSGLSWNKMG